MIFPLLLKDLRVHGKKTFFHILPASTLLAVFLIFRHYEWHIFMMYGYISASFAVIQFGLTEANPDNSVLLISLPVSRRAVVLTRYLTGFILFALYLVCWYGVGIAATYLLPNARTDFSNALHLKGVYISLVYIGILLAVYIPASLLFRSLGVILLSIPAFLGAIASVPLLFSPFEISYVPVFIPSDLTMVMVLSASLAVALCVSFIISTYFYLKRNI